MDPRNTSEKFGVAVVFAFGLIALGGSTDCELPSSAVFKSSIELWSDREGGT